MKKLIIGLVLSVGCIATVSAHGAQQHKKPASKLQKEQKAWGVAGEPKLATRTIAINMGDNMRFTPDVLNIKLGETIKFVINNKGKMLHELVIGTKQELDSHAALMLKFPEMEHSEAYMAHVASGKSADIVWTFNRAGDFEFACLIAGHYQSGMVGKITVAKPSQNKSS